MNSKKLKFFIDSASTLEECIDKCCEQISLAAQSMAKEKLELEHLNIYRNLSLALDKLTYYKYLTISRDNIETYKQASIVEESAESILNDLKVFIYGHSNKTDSVLPYLDYASKEAFNLTDERLSKLLEVITAKFNGKKVDRRKM